MRDTRGITHEKADEKLREIRKGQNMKNKKI